MIAYFLTYKLKSKEDRDSFLNELLMADIPAICEKEQGCIKYKYFLPCDNGSDLLLLEEWESVEDQQLHTTQPHFATILNLKEKYNVITECDSFDK